jgi:hypothetical protein
VFIHGLYSGVSKKMVFNALMYRSGCDESV